MDDDYQPPDLAPDRHLKPVPFQGQHNAKNKSKRLTKAKQQHRVLQLAAAALTDAEIREVMRKDGYRWSYDKVRNFLRDTLKEWTRLNSDRLAEYREITLFELEQLKRAVWTDALKGDTDAVREARSVIKTQLEMSGAAAPRRHEHKVALDVDIEPGEIEAMERAWINAAPPLELPPGEDIPEVEIVE